MANVFVFGSNLAGRHGKGAALYAKNHYDIDFGDDSIDLMKQAYVAGLRMAHDLLDNAEEHDFHWCRRQIETLIEESE